MIRFSWLAVAGQGPVGKSGVLGVMEHQFVGVA